eukprot:jgi/Chrzof1/10784/Cz05g11310.t1
MQSTTPNPTTAATAFCDGTPGEPYLDWRTQFATYVGKLETSTKSGKLTAHKILNTIDDQFARGSQGHELKTTCQLLLYPEVDLFAFTTLNPAAADPPAANSTADKAATTVDLPANWPALPTGFPRDAGEDETRAQWRSAIQWFMKIMDVHLCVATPQTLKDFESMKQGHGKKVAANETPEGFMHRMKNLSQLVRHELSESRIKMIYLNGLQPAIKLKTIRLYNALPEAEQTLQAAATFATNLTRSREKQELYLTATGRPGKASADGLKAEVSQLTAAEQRKLAKQMGWSAPANDKTDAQPYCEYHKMFGHHTNECKARQREDSQGGKANSATAAIAEQLANVTAQLRHMQLSQSAVANNAVPAHHYPACGRPACSLCGPHANHGDHNCWVQHPSQIPDGVRRRGYNCPKDLWDTYVANCHKAGIEVVKPAGESTPGNYPRPPGNNTRPPTGNSRPPPRAAERAVANCATVAPPAGLYEEPDHALEGDHWPGGRVFMAIEATDGDGESVPVAAASKAVAGFVPTAATTCRVTRASARQDAQTVPEHVPDVVIHVTGAADAAPTPAPTPAVTVPVELGVAPAPATFTSRLAAAQRVAETHPVYELSKDDLLTLAYHGMADSIVSKPNCFPAPAVKMIVQACKLIGTPKLAPALAAVVCAQERPGLIGQSEGLPVVARVSAADIFGDIEPQGLYYFEGTDPARGVSLHINGVHVVVERSFIDGGATIQIMSQRYADRTGVRYGATDKRIVTACGNKDAVQGYTLERVLVVIAAGTAHEVTVLTHFYISAAADATYDMLLGNRMARAVGGMIDPETCQFVYRPFKHAGDLDTVHCLPLQYTLAPARAAYLGKGVHAIHEDPVVYPAYMAIGVEPEHSGGISRSSSSSSLPDLESAPALTDWDSDSDSIISYPASLPELLSDDSSDDDDYLCTAPVGSPECYPHIFDPLSQPAVAALTADGVIILDQTASWAAVTENLEARSAQVADAASPPTPTCTPGNTPGIDTPVPTLNAQSGLLGEGHRRGVHQWHHQGGYRSHHRRA